jgi:hypothetical protein
MTASHPFILVALATLGPLAAVLVGLLSVLAAAVATGRRPTLWRVVFNLGAVALTGAAMAWAYLAAGGSVSNPLETQLAPLTVAALVLFVVNSGLVSAAIALEKGQGLFLTWRETFGWNGWTYLMGLTIAIAMLAVIDAGLVWVLAVAAAPCWLLISFYRNHRARQVAVH